MLYLSKKKIVIQKTAVLTYTLYCCAKIRNLFKIDIAMIFIVI